ncbi:cytochrome b [Allorhizobium sp. BGMRC 0089]|uniref:cytochrome b n=1 Tax=Allorhizobium sonneratiae TaxID=2934936 RepID=UPI0020336D52|nr:cytochrome b [Allorhizobium sonneratiae]MCM2291886.1 cytochrome b [Allorhizobium sonneratiae]
MTDIINGLAVQTHRQRYNSGMIWLHWSTVILVLTLFGTAEVWDFYDHGSDVRAVLHTVHIAAGICLAAVFILRVLWRLISLKNLPEDEPGLMGLAAKAAHYALYLALAGQVCLGFALRFSQGRDVPFFNLFAIPRLIDISRDYRHAIGELHNVLAWAIIAVSAIHACAAIFHHVVLKDGVLKKMLP